MFTLSLRLTTLLSGFLLFSSSAQAHPGHAMLGLSDGFMHPLLGLDHLAMAMVVGLFAGMRRPRRFFAQPRHSQAIDWKIPAIFLLLMTLGVFLSELPVLAMLMPMLENLILLSLLAIAMMLPLYQKLTPWLATMLVAVFGLLHGMVHGAELHISQSLQGNGGAVLAGLLLATCMLHGIGILVGLGLRRFGFFAHTNQA